MLPILALSARQHCHFSLQSVRGTARTLVTFGLIPRDSGSEQGVLVDPLATLIADRVSALLETTRRKGSAILFNTLVVGIGFAVLMFSSFPPIRHFGIFVFASMVTSCVFALMFLPALYCRFGIRGRRVDV